jgi:hypothetical protein
VYTFLISPCALQFSPATCNFIHLMVQIFS